RDLRREIRGEELLLALGADAWAVVGHDVPRMPRLGHVYRLDPRDPIVADRLDRVVDEIEDGALDVVRVHLEQREVVGMMGLDREGRMGLAVEARDAVDELAHVGWPRREHGHP